MKRVSNLLCGATGVLLMAVQSLSPIQAQATHAKISAAQAKAVALARYPGRVEGRINLENEEGSWQYAVNVRSGKKLREVMVNAKTGKIANVEVTTRAEELKEAQAEAAQKKHTHKISNRRKG